LTSSQSIELVFAELERRSFLLLFSTDFLGTVQNQDDSFCLYLALCFVFIFFVGLFIQTEDG